MTGWLIGTAMVFVPFAVGVWLAMLWNLRRSERAFRETIAHMDRRAEASVHRAEGRLAELAPKPPAKYQVSDGKLSLVLEPAEEGGYVVTSPNDPGLVTQADTLEEAFRMAYDAAEMLRLARQQLAG